MSDKRMKERLQEYDRALGRTPLRASAQRRTRDTLQQVAALQAAQSEGKQLSSGGSARGRYGVALACACACVVLVLWGWRRDAEPRAAVSDSASCAVQVEGAERRLSGACELELPQLSARSEAGALVVENGGRVSVQQGRVHFAVRHVPLGGKPVQVKVLGGVIEVLGTEFDVRQEASFGQVTLHSGRIRFAGAEGVVLLVPGQSHRWSVAAQGPPPSGEPLPDAAVSEVSEAAASEAAGSEAAVSETAGSEAAGSEGTSAANGSVNNEGTTRAPVGADADVRKTRVSGAARPDAVEGADARAVPAGRGKAAPAKRPFTGAQAPSLAAVLELRAQGRYREALARLDQLIAAGGGGNPEAISYERITLLLRLGAPVCSAVAAHRQRFAAGSYEDALREQIAACQETSAGVGGE